mmetsp:Transcript_14067/g.16776  ORF Transcript_14067/g.16776 Transcript_14067/m.16776 type:complete len:88 (-) Transcript_14067:251-514(-)
MLNHDFSQFRDLNRVAEVFDAFERMAIAALCIIIIVPICSCKGTILCTPLTLITISGMFISIFTLLTNAIEQLEGQISAMSLPTRFY